MNKKAVRPSLPYLLLPSIILFFGVFFTLHYLANILVLKNTSKFFIGILVSISLVLTSSSFIFKNISRTLFISILLLLTGIILVFISVNNLNIDRFKNPVIIKDAQILITSDMCEKAFSNRVQICVMESQRGAFLAEAKIKKNQNLAYGAHYKADLYIEPLSRDEWGKAAMIKGESCSVRILSLSEGVFPRTISGFISKKRFAVLSFFKPFVSESRALTTAVTTGFDTALKCTNTYDIFSVVGLSHLVAVSGSHLALVASITKSIIGRLTTKRDIQAVMLISFTGIFVVFTALQPSAIRSWIMACSAYFPLVTNRRKDSLSALSFAVIIMILINPFVVTSIGFQLSILSVFGIVTFTPFLDVYISKILPTQISKAVSMTVIAQIMSLPIIVDVFGVFSFIAPLANVMCAPLVGLVIFGGVLCALLVASPFSLLSELAAIGFKITDYVSKFIIFISSKLASLPMSSIALSGSAFSFLICVTFLVIVVWIFWNRLCNKKILAITCIGFTAGALLCILQPFIKGPQCVALDVGQGDSILIRDGFKTMLVDTGPPGNAITHALGRHFVTKIDYMVITHFDSDHVGALSEVAKVCSIENLVIPYGSFLNMDKEMKNKIEQAGVKRIFELKGNDTILLNRFTFKVIWPYEKVSGLENEDSIVSVLTYSENTYSLNLLLTGDAEKDVLTKLTNTAGQVDILKVPHHGAKNGINNSIITSLNPQVAIISCGINNNFGHPTKECLEILKNHNVIIYRTDVDGDIVISFRTRRIKTKKAT